MIFAAEPVEAAAGGLLAHGIRGAGFSFKKGRILSGDDVALLAAGGCTSVTVARLEAGDVGEDEAAAALAATLAGDGIVPAAAATGRTNLYAHTSGLLQVDATRINAGNAVDEAMTVATLAADSVVRPQQMVATVKIIPFAVSRHDLARCLDALHARAPALSVAPFHPHRAGLVQTRLPGFKTSLLKKTQAVTSARLGALGSELAETVVVEHAGAEVAAAIAAQRRRHLDPILVAGASAIVDRRDVIPAAILACGGEIVHFGMPVDPGNLLLLARLDGAAVIGLPGCARSPQANGLDLVLARLLAGLPVGSAEISGWGVGGLLAEIPQRPLPRKEAEGSGRTVPMPAPHIGAVVLAAGQGTRMGSGGKLLLEVAGQPLLRAAVDAALASAARPVIVVTGYRAAEVRAALAGLDVSFADNPRFAEGLSGSLAEGIRALPPGLAGVAVLLADMPKVRACHIDALIAAFAAAPAGSIIVPTAGDRRGNPVLWPAPLFAELAALEGDIGGRELLRRYPDRVRAVPMADDAVLMDADEPRDLAALATVGPE